MAPIALTLAARASGDNCPSTLSGGAIAGIVIGTIAGTLLLQWLWHLCQLPGVCCGGEPDPGYSPPVTRTRTRRRSTGSYVDVIEKPVSTRSSRRYRDDVRRPARVYVS